MKPSPTFPLSLLIFSSVTVFSQSLSPEAVTSAGIKMVQPSASVSFTVGELVVEPLTDSNGNTLGSGFTSSAANSTSVLPVTLPESEVLGVRVYPNPTSDLLTIDVSNATIEMFVVELNDMLGKSLQSGTYAGLNNRIGINLSQYPSGNYTLHLRQTDGKLLGAFRIVRQ